MTAQPPPPPVCVTETRGAAAVVLFARLRWRLVRSTLRSGGAQALATLVSLAGSVFVGFVGGTAVAIAVRQVDDPAPFLTVLPVGVVAVVVTIGVVTGVAQPVDPRVLATEPLRHRWLTVGLLTTSAFGPPGIATVLFTTGVVAGAAISASAILPVLIAAVGLLATLLLVSRTTVNLLALLTIRFPRVGQSVVGLMSLGLYGSFQFAPRLFFGIDGARRDEVAEFASWTPPGQIGRAFATAADSPATSIGHSFLGVLWLPLVAAALTATTHRIVTASSDGVRGRRRTGQPPGVASRVVRRVCGQGPTGALAWRGLLTRLRQPRTALETFIGAGIGLAIVLGPVLTRDDVGPAAVLVGGAVQLSVLFMAGNSFGSDGPALGAEILCGVAPEVIVRAKVRSILIVASPLTLIGPALGASLTGEWSYLPAGVAVGVAGMLSGSAGAIVQATFVPVAVPPSDNPLASGDTGSGVLAAVVLVAVLICLSVMSVPFAILLAVTLSTGSVPLVSLAAVVSLAAGAAVLRGALEVSTRRWRDREPEIHQALLPSR